MLPFPMVGRIPPPSSPPVVPFRSFLPANLLGVCPSDRRPSVPFFPQHPIVVHPSAPLNSRPFKRATLTTFRINTCKSVSKQRTLTPFRINTYEKHRGGGGGQLFIFFRPSHAPRNASIRCALSRLRMLSVTTGVYYYPPTASR